MRIFYFKVSFSQEFGLTLIKISLRLKILYRTHDSVREFIPVGFSRRVYPSATVVSPGPPNGA